MCEKFLCADESTPADDLLPLLYEARERRERETCPIIRRDWTRTVWAILSLLLRLAEIERREARHAH